MKYGDRVSGHYAFGYDRRGNRITHTDRSGASLTYHFDVADQLLAVRDAATSQDIRTFDYDDAGRRVTESWGGTTRAYSYDALSRLTGMELVGAPLQVTLAYDAMGMRYRRTATGAQDALYFGEWIERTGGTSRRLVHLSGLDQVIAEVTEAGEQRALLRNGTANVTHVAVDGQMDEQLGSGALAARRYEAFGSVRSGTASTERGFAGRPVEHAFFGLVNFRARHYDPMNGVFLQPDPLGIDAVDVYAYGRNNPYAFIDPTGFDPTAIRSGVPSLSDTVSNALFGDFGSGLGFDNFATSPAPSSESTPLIWQPGFSLGDRFHNLAFGDGAGIFYPEISFATNKVYGGIDDALGNYPSAILGPINDFLTWELCENCNTGIVTIPGRGPKWPKSPAGMDKLLGFPGKRIPDGPTTPGRNKVEWRPNQNTRIIYEQHPYHPDAPDWHRGPHWHQDTPGQPHKRYLPGDDIPGYD